MESVKKVSKILVVLICILGFTPSNILAEIPSKNGRSIDSSHFILIAKAGNIFLKTFADSDSIETKWKINGEEVKLIFRNKLALLDIPVADKAGKLIFVQSPEHHILYHVAPLDNNRFRVRHIPLWLSILPPLIAILLALLFKEVIIALFIGVFSGAFVGAGMRFDSLFYLFLSFLSTLSKYILSALADTDHLAVIIFSLLIGGMVAIISRNGGMAGVVKSLSRYAKGPVSTQFITWLIGVAIFFDDYANTLIVGNTMRNVTDKFKISREKLAYIVDSTAAPVAAIAFITTWIGAELGYIADGILYLEGFNPNLTPYSIFLGSLKYAYYPVLTLIFILLIIFLKRDFGPMYHAEIRARTTGRVSAATKGVDDEPDMEDLSPVAGVKKRWINAVIPVSLVVLMTIYGLVETGMETSHTLLLDRGVVLQNFSWALVWKNLSLLSSGVDSSFHKLGIIIGNSNSFTALLWGSLTGVVAAILLTLSQKIMKLRDTMFSMITGFKTMIPALIILTLAWSLAICTRELHTAEFLTSAISGFVNPYFMPMLVFILSGLIAFSTGSSWSTMAILFPIAIPATWSICMAYGLDEQTSQEILLNVIRGVLGAAVFGDHVSPISDTTILSSLASDCNHMDHVKTQLPYALVVGAVSIISITVAAFWGGSFFSNTILLLVDVGILYLIVMRFGKKLPSHILAENQ